MAETAGMGTLLMNEETVIDDVGLRERDGTRTGAGAVVRVEVEVTKEEIEIEVLDNGLDVVGERGWMKRRKGGNSKMEVLEGVVRSMGGDAGKVYDHMADVMIQYLEIGETGLKFLTVSLRGEVVLKCDGSKWGPLADLMLLAASQKCVEYELKQVQWEDAQVSKLKRDKRSGKRKKHNVLLQQGRIPRLYPELELSELVLRWDNNGDWRLDIKVSLWCNMGTVNHFSSDTNFFLDFLYTKEPSYFMKQDINHCYVHRHFLHQITQYTRETLKSVKQLPKLPMLRVSLLPFQMQSVKWMSDKENVKKTYDVYKDELISYLNEQVSYGYEKIGNLWFWNKFSGYVLSESDALQLYESYLREPVSTKGVLSEEMGLGKTIEILALLLLNVRPLPEPANLEYTLLSSRKTITRVKTNLIICPQSILEQFLDEIELHVKKGALKTYYYRGFLKVKEEFKTDSIFEIVTHLSQYDIIIVSYTTVSAEIHYAEYTTSLRSRRHKAPKYDYSSPLSLMEFYRIILDEVQMLGSDSTNAARCTGLLQRVHTWGVSGTPIHSISDFKTVLSYLQIHPFQNYSKCIDIVSRNMRRMNTSNGFMISEQRSKLETVNGVRFTVHDLMDIPIKLNLCIRHSKHDVKGQIKIPKQQNYIVPLNFTPIEQDNYSNLWESFLEVSGYHSNGQGVCHLGANVLNHWLSQLRKTCSYAMMSYWNFNIRDAGSSIGSNMLPGKKNSQSLTLPNINDVLTYMITSVEDSIDSLHNENYSLKIQSAQVKMELENDPNISISILKDVEESLLADFRNDLDVTDPFQLVSQPSHSNKTVDESSSLKKKKKIRSHMDYLHQCHFFIATAYYFKGSKKLEKVDEDNEKLNMLGHESEVKQYTSIFPEAEMKKISEFQELEQSYYSTAEKLRKCILAVNAEKVHHEIQTVKKYLNSKRVADKLQLKSINFNFKDFSTSMTVAACYNGLSSLFKSMNEQVSQFNGLLAELEALCFKPIIHQYNEPEDNEKAQEYENSINDQDKIFAILDCLERILANRDDVITAEDEIKLAKSLLLPGEIISAYHKYLLSKQVLVQGIPFRPLFADLKNVSLVMNLSIDATKPEESFESYLLGYEGEMGRIKKENHFIRELLKRFNSIYNARTAYFSHLQRISDSLVSLIQLEPSAKSNILRNTKDDFLYQRNVKKISNLESRLKYLKTLTTVEKVVQDNKKFTCTICLSEILHGSIINCGHFFCQSCIKSWLKTKSACPLCKIDVTLSEVYNFKFQQVKETAEAAADLIAMTTVNDMGKSVSPQLNEQPSIEKGSNPTRAGESITNYSEKYRIYPETHKIGQLVANTNYGAKIDFVIKLIKYLQLQQDNKTTSRTAPLQIAIYSQYVGLLDMLAHVMKLNSIKFVSTTKKGSKFSKVIETFKTDPQISCILLDIKRQASGLTLVNATHVFLLEPIVNSGDELQAVNRIHRIGQKNETYVWNFMIRNTVEENILRYKVELEKKKIESHKERNRDNLNTCLGKHKNIPSPFNDGDSGSGSGADNDSDENDEYNINQVGGEDVSEKHLWNCFFGPSTPSTRNKSAF